VSVRHLEELLAPRSIAVIGASPKVDSLGGVAWRRLRAGGFRGEVYPVNLHHDRLDGVRVWRRVAELPRPPSLALICTPPATVPTLVDELGRRGTRAAVVLTRGLDAATRQAMLGAARPHTLRILGPGGAGLQVPHLGLDAGSFPVVARTGAVALVSQSGSVVGAMLDWARARDIGFSRVVALGESADVDVGDLLDYLGSDARTRAILLYATDVGEARKFLSAARAAARNKPVIVVKAGRAPTGAAPGPVNADALFDAVVARAGMLRVRTLHELFLAAETLDALGGGAPPRLVVLGNGAGTCVLAADEAVAQALPLQPLDADACERLQRALPDLAAPTNPLDLGDEAAPARYAAAAQALLADGRSALLLVHAPNATVSSVEVARAVLPLAQAQPRRLLACWLGEHTVAEARALLRGVGVPDYETPEAAVRAFGFLHAYHRHQAELLETPPAHGAACTPDEATLRAIVREALATGRRELAGTEARALLAAAGLPTPAPAEAIAAAPRRLRHACQLGTRIDPRFGPVLLLCDGEVGGRHDGDVALALPPLNRALARAQVRRSRLQRRPEADVEALAGWLVGLSQLLVALPELEALDVHLLLDGTGRVAVRRAHIHLSEQRPAGAAHFAILPYPAELVETWPWRGQALTLRPIRPEDEPQHQDFLARVTPEDLRLRLFYSRRGFDHAELARLTQIDYAREMAFIATRPRPEGGEETLGAVRAVVDPDNDTAEFGVLVRSDLQGGGLGRRLMTKMIDYLRRRGTRRLVGTVLCENTSMLALARALGFEESACPDEPGLCRIELDLLRRGPA
jgi:acetyltransferase